MTTTNAALYSGKTDGLTFEKVDDMVISWGRKKYGDKYANALWKNELLLIANLDLTDDSEAYGFETYCESMFDISGQRSGRWNRENVRGKRCFAIWKSLQVVKQNDN
jgi:hypothetical protein